MTRQNYFEDLWKLNWGVGIFYHPPKVFKSFFIITGFIDHEYFFFASPLVTDFSQFELALVEEEFKKINHAPAIYLTEKQLQNGFLESLVLAGYKWAGSEYWMGYSPTRGQKPTEAKLDITEIDATSFQKFRSVADEVFAQYPTQDAWSQICSETLIGTKQHSGVTSKFFLVSEEGIPASTGAMFYSQKDNFAYLHTDATLEKFRGKGYQTTLINKRVELARSQGITRIYSIVDQGSKSWSNYIKSNFHQIQNLVLLKKK